jgi:hypothetical protein
MSDKRTSKLWQPAARVLQASWLELIYDPYGMHYDGKLVLGIGLRLWCLMPLPTLFQLYHGGQFYWWRKLEYPEILGI